MRLLGRDVLPRVLGPHGKPPKAEAVQHLADRTFGYYDSELSLDLIRQVNPSPADNAVLIQIRTLLHPLRYDGLLLDRQKRWSARRAAV